jgi:hypothetical protein
LPVTESIGNRCHVQQVLRVWVELRKKPIGIVTIRIISPQFWIS